MRSKYLPQHADDRVGERRHHRAEHDALNAPPIDLAVRKQPVDGQAELISRAVPQGLKAPASNEFGAFEHAKDDVAVADVNR